MTVLVVDTAVNNPDDGRLSFAEAWVKAGRLSIQSGETVTIAFAQATDIGVTGTLRLRNGADVVIDGRIQGDTSFEIGTGDVVFRGNGGVGYNPASPDAYGFTMFEIDAGAALRMIDVAVANHLAAGAAGRNGASGSDGINGSDGGGEGLPGSPGNGGESVATDGRRGQDAVGGILNEGTLVLDRVNFTSVSGYGGTGGSGGSGGKGGDGGDGGSNANGGPGGPGGSGLGRGGTGGDAAGAVMNMGSLTLIDTFFQSCLVSAGQGGQGGSGGRGGDGGSGTFGGFGGNGGLGGTGGNGGNGAATVLNRGNVTVQGGWADGDNLVFAGSGLGGRGGSGGTGGVGGEGEKDEDDGGDGINPIDGPRGTDGRSDEVRGIGGGLADSTYFIETNWQERPEFAGAFDVTAVVVTVYRLGSASGTGSVSLSLEGLNAAATGGSVQGGLFDSQVISFADGQQIAQRTFFLRADGLEGDEALYRFRISDAQGGEMGGNRSADLRVTNSDITGTASADRLRGTDAADNILAGLGNDTIFASDGNDQANGEGGVDTLTCAAVLRGAGNTGVVADLLNFAVSGRGIGEMRMFNVENVVGSDFNDTMTGDFNANLLDGGNGDDSLDGGFNNDRLSGGAGRDILVGGLGADTLDGGVGRDTLTGGDGADVFLFSAGPAADMALNRDNITDFAAGIDTIQLQRSGDGPFDALRAGDLDEGAFHIGTHAKRGAHRIIYDDRTGQLLYDADGKGGAAAVVLAVLEGAPDISSADFLVI